MEKEKYLNISKASDIKEKKDRIIYRIFEMIPGLLSAGTLLGVFFLSWLFPIGVAIFIIIFCFFYFLRIIYFSVHQLIAYFKIKKNLKKNWLKELKKLPRWKEIYHIIILPTYKEGRVIIEETIQALLNSYYPKEKLIVALSVEERAGEEFKKQAEALARKYESCFYKFLFCVHPANIKGEISGKGSNTAFAGQRVKELVDQLKIPYENILVSTFDIDTKVFPYYFACLTWYYLTEKDSLHASYQPVPIYNNNIWSAPFFSRVVSTSNTFWQMIQQERSEKLTTYSSHATPARVFFEVGYPHNVVSDDSRIFWKAYLYYDGRYRVVPIYYLVSMDAVMARNLWRTILNQYKQQRRWAWGCNEIPYIMFGFLKNKNIPLKSKIFHLLTMIDGFWAWATAALLLFVLGWLPIILGGERFNFTVLSFNLPIYTSRIMTISMVGMLLCAILSTLLLPPFPKKMKWQKKILKRVSIFLQWFFLPVTLIVFGSLPALDAQIRLLLGRYLGFWVTEKMRNYSK